MFFLHLVPTEISHIGLTAPHSLSLNIFLLRANKSPVYRKEEVCDLSFWSGQDHVVQTVSLDSVVLVRYR